MEKLEKLKHNHKLTDILKVLVFALIILFPFIVLTPTCLYYGFNEHATNENYIATPKYQTNEVNSVNDLIEGNIYHLDELTIGPSNPEDTSFGFVLLNFSDADYDLGNTYSDEMYFSSYNANNDNCLSISYVEGGEVYIFATNNNAYVDIVFYQSGSYITFYDADFYIEDSSINVFKTLVLDEYFDLPSKSDFNVYEYTKIDNITDNVSYAWEEMWNTNLFSWTKNSPFKTSINGFLAVFQIPQQSGLGLYLNYLITMTGIYVVIDIVIELFKWITHLIGNK